MLELSVHFVGDFNVVSGGKPLPPYLMILPSSLDHCQALPRNDCAH